MKFDVSKFWAAYTGIFHHDPNSLERAGTETLLNLISADAQITDVRYAAYLLATIRNECGANMQPLREIKAKPGTLVWEKYQSKYWGTGFYGRGYSQLTEKDNYQQFSRLLYNDDRLVRDPDLVMQPEVGYQILATGMVKGLFRRRSATSAYKLSDFFNATTENPHDARLIVNGIGGAPAYAACLRAAGYYHQYKPCLEAALIADAGDASASSSPAR